MRELWFWRAATAVACLGWALTWWSAEPEAELGAELSEQSAESVASRGEAGPEWRQVAGGRGLGRGELRGEVPHVPGSEGLSQGDAPEDLGQPPAVEVSEASLELARRELMAERDQRFIARMEERHRSALDTLDSFAEEQGLSEDEVAGLEEAIELRFEAMGEIFSGDEEMEPDARREHMRAVADAFEMQVVGALGEELGAIYLDQQQRPLWGQVGGAEQ